MDWWSQVSLYHMGCKVASSKEGLEEVIFLYKVCPGACPKSYGVNVARLAGMPESILQRASTCSAELELSFEKRNSQAAFKLLKELGCSLEKMEPTLWNDCCHCGWMLRSWLLPQPDSHTGAYHPWYLQLTIEVDVAFVSLWLLLGNFRRMWVVAADDYGAIWQFYLEPISILDLCLTVRIWSIPCTTVPFLCIIGEVRIWTRFWTWLWFLSEIRRLSLFRICKQMYTDAIARKHNTSTNYKELNLIIY